MDAPQVPDSPHFAGCFDKLDLVMAVFQVLRCAQCETFQVLQVTKSKKWKCKLCGQKQSVIKVFGQGTGAECRHHVQKLNTLRGQNDHVKEENHLDVAFSLSAEKSVPLDFPFEEPLSYSEDTKKSESRWSSYLDDHNENEEEEEMAREATGSSLWLRCNKEFGLGGHVTTDWREFSKRKREMQSEFGKRKYLRAETDSASCERKPGMNSPKVLHAGAEHKEQSSWYPNVSQSLNANTVFNVEGRTHNSTIQDMHKWHELGIDDSHVKDAQQQSGLRKKSSEVVGILPSLSSQVKELKSTRESVQQKIVPKVTSMPLVSSKWAMFLNEEESEGEEEEEEFDL